MIQRHETTVMIIGLAATGKTTLAEQLAKEYPNYKVIHTDEFIDNYDRLVEYIKQFDLVIVEGVLCYTLLTRKHLFPQLIIEVMATTSTRETRCLARGSSANVRGQDSVLNSQWANYRRQFNVVPPRMIQYVTE